MPLAIIPVRSVIGMGMGCAPRCHIPFLFCRPRHRYWRVALGYAESNFALALLSISPSSLCIVLGAPVQAQRFMFSLLRLRPVARKQPRDVVAALTTLRRRRNGGRGISTASASPAAAAAAAAAKPTKPVSPLPVPSHYHQLPAATSITLQSLMNWTRDARSAASRRAVAASAAAADKPGQLSSRDLVVRARAFLRDELALRMARRAAAISRLSPALLTSVPAIAQYHQHLLDSAKSLDAPLLLKPDTMPPPAPAIDDDLLKAFDTRLDKLMTNWHTGLNALTMGMRDHVVAERKAASAPAGTGTAAAGGEAQELLRHAYYLTIGLRTLSAHHRFTHALWRDPLAQPRNSRVTLVSRFTLYPVLKETISEARAFCVEKYGVAPEFDVSALPADLSCVAVESHVHFVLMELAKNAMRAVIDRYGVLSLADGVPPIVVRAEKDAATNSVSITFRDRGLSALASQAATHLALSDEKQYPTVQAAAKPVLEAASRAAKIGAGANRSVVAADAQQFAWFATSALEPVADASGYGYSRRFGASMTGLGVGLPVAHEYARWSGGRVAFVESDAFYAANTGGGSTQQRVLQDPNAATVVRVTFNQAGTASGTDDL